MSCSSLQPRSTGVLFGKTVKNSGGTTGRSLVWQWVAAAGETAVACDPAGGELPARMQPVPEPSLPSHGS